jgi:predicted nucleic acid-binding protein
MKMITYKVGKRILPISNKNNYYQFYFADKLIYKGYVKNNKKIGYSEDYKDWLNKGIKYKI